jgi:hypothetical protein
VRATPSHNTPANRRRSAAAGNLNHGQLSMYLAVAHTAAGAIAALLTFDYSSTCQHPPRCMRPRAS